MKGAEKRMNIKNRSIVVGKVIKEYQLPLNEIEQLNNIYEQEKEKLNSFGDRLAGRLDSELDFTKLIEKCDIYKSIIHCMTDYINACRVFFDHHTEKSNYNLEILSCWINDMKAGEYNPPHTHHNNEGWSTVLFLKVPHFVNDLKKEPHRFRDGQLFFNNINVDAGQWFMPEVGNFYIFEAQHTHSVMPFKTVRETDVRRSMSFNFIHK
jgi:hypothetical protein|tara:strand:- start:4565 stop:5191 length:627 start_codon:yes stop_codon:yes gene_type:complete